MGAIMINIERRQAYRINDSLLFSCQPLVEKEFVLAMKQTENFAKTRVHPFPTIAIQQLPTTVNLSMNGMAFATEERFVVGDYIAVTLLLSITAPPLRIVARVIDFVPDPEGVTGYVRLNFETMAQYNRLRLANYTMHKVEQHSHVG